MTAIGLPAELLITIFDFIVSALTTSPPPWYRDLRSFALVHPSWTAPAQALLSREIHCSRGDEQMKSWLAAGRKGTVTVIVHVKQWWESDEYPYDYEWTPEIMLRVFRRCRKATRFSCNLPLAPSLRLHPLWLSQSFPALESLAVAFAYRNLCDQHHLEHLTSFTFLGAGVDLAARALLSDILLQDWQAGHLPRLTTLALNDGFSVSALSPLLPHIRSLHITPIDVAPSAFYEIHPLDRVQAIYGLVLPKCRNLLRLTVHRLDRVLNLHELPPTLQTLIVKKLTPLGSLYMDPDLLKEPVPLEQLSKMTLPTPLNRRHIAWVDALKEWCKERSIELEWMEEKREIEWVALEGFA